MYKYKIQYNNDTYIGNTVDEVAKGISKDPRNNISFTDAVLYVSRNIIPVVHSKRPETPTKESLTDSVTLREIANGATAVLKQTFLNQVEDQGEINRRAMICSDCPLVSEVSGCRACGMGKKLKQFGNNVKQMFGKGRNIPYGLQENYCSVCKCSLAMLLPAKLDQIEEETRIDPNRPNRCWAKR